MRNNELRFLVLILMLVVALTGCGNTESPRPIEPQENQMEQSKQQEQPVQTGTEKSRLTNVVDHFRSQGLSVGKITPKAYEMLGAIDGFGIEVEGEQIELYLFDLATADEDTLKQLDSARTFGKMSMSGITFPVIMNDGITLTRFDEHDEKDKIIEIFKIFK